MTAGVVVFARHPAPGQVKTRLIPRLGPVGAAELYDCLLADTLAQCRDTAWQCAVALEPAERVEAMARRLGGDFVVMAQLSGADLGARMAHALAHAPAHWDRIVIVGSDAVCPLAQRLSEAFAVLLREPLVLGPALDGGYYLIGFRREALGLAEALFAPMPWSTADVLPQTLARAHQQGVVPTLLAAALDIDVPGDLDSLAAAPGWAAWLPRTAMWLESRVDD